MSSSPSGYVKLCRLESTKEYISCFDARWGKLDKLVFVKNSLFNITGESKTNCFSNIYPEAGIFKVSFEKFSGWKFLINHTICSLTLRLARVKYWGYSTQRVFLIVLTKLTSKLLDLSINLQWTPLQAVLPEVLKPRLNWCQDALTGLAYFLFCVNQ